MRLLSTTVFLLAATCAASAQPVPGTCELGEATAVLDANDVRAHLYNTGSLFFGNGYEAEYVVPAESGISPLYAYSFWVGGTVGGELRTAGATYSNFEFWPGPLGDDARPADPEDCSAYDRIYRVSRADVARYLAGEPPTDDLRDWPADLGAPVLDGDGVEGNYNLEGGDQPAIWADQMAWWVMNDVGNEHRYTETQPIGLEVRAEAFAASAPPSQGVPAVEQATFYRYTLTHRGEAPLEDAYLALFLDPDLGDLGDDYVGADTLREMGFVYNANRMDAMYGVPPAFGAQIIEGPVGLPNGRDDDGDRIIDENDERLGLTALMYYELCPGCSGPPEPATGEEMYNNMRGLWTSGVPLTEGGGGFQTGGDTTTYAFPGDPVEEQFWSEVNADGQGSERSPGERRFMVSVGPFRIEPGESDTVVFALPFAQGRSNLSSVTALRTAATVLSARYAQGAFEPSRVSAEEAAPVEPPAETDLPTGYALRAFPNPFGAAATVEITVPESTVALRLTVYDVLGREVAVLAEGSPSAGVHPFSLDGAGLPSGAYFVRLALGGQTETLRLVHVD